MKLRAWVGKHLRYAADRIDPENAFVSGVGYFNIVLGKGLVFTRTSGTMIRPPAPGTQLYYRRSDYKGIIEES